MNARENGYERMLRERAGAAGEMNDFFLPIRKPGKEKAAHRLKSNNVSCGRSSMHTFGIVQARTDQIINDGLGRTNDR